MTDHDRISPQEIDVSYDLTTRAHALIVEAAGSDQSEWSKYDHGLMNICREADQTIATLKRCSAASKSIGVVPERETFWLLERSDGARWALYTHNSGVYIHSSTDDVWQAGRFESERAAHEVWRKLKNGERERWKPVEHMFINKVQEPKPHSPAGSSPELEAILKDPVAVHLNMLRGGIAMPSLENIKHLYPEVRDAFAAVEGAAVRDIAAERRRQIETEGWTLAHDDTHNQGEMANAAGAYCQSAARPRLFSRKPGAAFTFPMCWPWAREWWKPKNPRADLVRAGALIIAEIERLDRIAHPSTNSERGGT
jgi:hypothetical protein